MNLLSAIALATFVAPQPHMKLLLTAALATTAAAGSTTAELPNIGPNTPEIRCEDVPTAAPAANAGHPVQVCTGGGAITWPLTKDGVNYTCNGRASGGWGVNQATNLKCRDDINPVDATSTELVDDPSGEGKYICFFDCTADTPTLSCNNVPTAAPAAKAGYPVQVCTGQEWPLTKDGLNYTCNGRASGGWGVNQATNLKCRDDINPVDATSTELVDDPSGEGKYICFFDCTTATDKPIATDKPTTTKLTTDKPIATDKPTTTDKSTATDKELASSTSSAKVGFSMVVAMLAMLF